jgi:hypothetical protein
VVEHHIDTIVMLKKTTVSDPPGARSSLVEHVIDTDGVAGSIPAARTIPAGIKAAMRQAFMQCQHALKCLFFSTSSVPGPDIRHGVMLETAVTECLLAKQVSNRRPKYVKSLGQSLRQFTNEHRNFTLQEVTVQVLESWLARFPGQYYRLMWQYRLSTLFAFCVRRK